MTRAQGTVTGWDDERGFGFITPADGGPRVFVHISALPRGRRPAVGDVVTYAGARDERNRPRAVDVQPVGRGRAGGSGGGGRPGWAVPLAASGAFLVVVAVIALSGRAHLLVPAAYLLLSLASYALYASDKSAAQRGAWRVSESTLHLVDLLGGWPGGLVARHALRHKTRKQPFRTIFWVTVAVNLTVLAWLVFAPPELPRG